VFLMTVDLPVEERHGLLESLCAQDAELRAEVESLLASDCDSGTVIAEAVQSEASKLFDLEPLPGKRVGAYRIVREIGRGGMGAVYLASRDDEVYQKQVAIKVVKPGMDTADVLDRFRYERQILASLEHPYIARLFDGGSTDEGVPFFVMEYIEGEPVNVFCRSKTLNNRARCELFHKILEAVSYAHRSLVVHRDLKPGNIFVTADGTPKLLDFGVAKLISGNGEGSHTLTTLLRPFTPEYASPEQVLGLAVTTSTDIYSLGAVFYELLTDRRAQPILTPTPLEIERAVCQLEAPRPSEVAPSVDEDLDNIVLMAMRKEPERRYHSADQFAEDIERYLSGRPILARQDSVTYRLRKFLVRNRLELATVSVLIVGLSGGLAVSLLQTRRANEALRLAESQRLVAIHENARATAEARKSEEALASEARQRAIAERQTSIAEEQRDDAQHQKALAEERAKDLLDLSDRALFRIHDAVAKLPGSMAARQEIVNTTLDYLKRLENENGLDDELRLALAAGYYKVSLIQGDQLSASLQDFAGAEASLQKARNMILPLYEKNGDDPAVVLRWVEIQRALAGIADQAGHIQEVIAIDSPLLPIAHRLAQMKPCSVDCESQEAFIDDDLAEQYLRLSDPRGLEYATHGIVLAKELLLRYPDDRGLKLSLSSDLDNVAEAASQKGDLDGAAVDLQQSITLSEELLKKDPYDAVVRRNLMIMYATYAGILGTPSLPNLGRPAEALIYGAKVVALAREMESSDPQDVTARFDLGMALVTLGMIDPAPDGLKDSLASLQEAISLIEPIAKANPKSSFYAYRLSNALDFEGRRLEALGRTAEAIKSYRRSLEVLQPFFDSGNTVMVYGQRIRNEEDLAQVLSSTGDYAAALELASGAVAQSEKRVATGPPSEQTVGSLARAYARLAAVEEEAGKPDEARQSAEKARSTWKQVHSRGALSIYPSVMAANDQRLARLNATLPAK